MWCIRRLSRDTCLCFKGFSQGLGIAAELRAVPVDKLPEQRGLIAAAFLGVLAPELINGEFRLARNGSNAGDGSAKLRASMRE